MFVFTDANPIQLFQSIGFQSFRLCSTQIQSIILGFPIFFPPTTSDSAGMAVNDIDEDWMSDLKSNFIPSEWIGKDKNFRDAHLYVNRALHDATVILNSWKL